MCSSAARQSTSYGIIRASPCLRLRRDFGGEPAGTAGTQAETPPGLGYPRVRGDHLKISFLSRLRLHHPRIPWLETHHLGSNHQPRTKVGAAVVMRVLCSSILVFIQLTFLPLGIDKSILWFQHWRNTEKRSLYILVWVIKRTR
ncbi:hypothetical protein GN956_G12371 [Arapaima gigas]